MEETESSFSAGNRSYLRFAPFVILPLVAIILLFLTVLPFWQYWRLFKEFRSYPVNADKIIAAAGIDNKTLTATDKALLADDWKTLHAAEPRNPVWFAQDFMSSCHTQTHSWSNGKPIAHLPITEDKLAEAAKIDPGNALFDYTATMEMLYLGTEYDDKRHVPIVKKRDKLMEALPCFLHGLQKPRYCNYWQEIVERRMQLAKYVSGIRADIWHNYLYSAPLSGYDFCDYFVQALPMWAEELIKAGHPDQAEQLLDCWSILVGQYSQSNYFWQLHSLVFMIKEFGKTLPPLYRKIGKPDKATSVGEFMDKISSEWLRRYAQNNKSPVRESVMADFQRYAPGSQQYLAASLLPGEYNMADYAPGRLLEYAVGDRLVMLIAMILLLSLLPGCCLSWLVIRFRLRRTVYAGLSAMDWKSILLLAAAGIIMPLALWQLLSVIPAGGREYALDYNNINFMAQSLFLWLALTLWPLALLRYAVEKKAVKLGLPGIKHSVRYYLVTIIVILTVIAVIGLLPWGGMNNYKLSTIVPQACYLYDYNYYFARPQNLITWIIIAGIAAAFLLLPLVETYRCRRDPNRLFKAGVTAETFIIGVSVIVIVLSVLFGIFAGDGESLRAQDKIGHRENSPRDKAAAEYRQYIRQQLAALPPVTVPQITYTLIDDKSFCSMIVTSPYPRIEEAVKQGADINAADETGHTALMLACRYRDAKIIDLLLRHGAKVDLRCPPQPSHHNWLNMEMLTGVDALMTAAFYNPDPAVIRLLLKYGAEPNRRSQSGYSRGGGTLFISDQMTPIMFAAWHNNPAVIQALLDAGVKISEQKNVWFGSILEIACLNNPDPQVAILLKKNGAKLNRNRGQMNSMITDCGGFDNEIPDKVCRRLQAMINVGFDPSLKDDRGMTVMDYARKYRELNNPDTIKRLEAIIKSRPDAEKP